MKIKIGTLIKCIAIPLLVGGLSGLLTRGSMQQFEMLNQPPLSLPGVIFPIVWTILYILMGAASYLVVTSDAEHEEKTEALALYGFQLVVNFFWSVFFFSLNWYLFAFAWLVMLWILIAICMILFGAIDKRAAWLLLPYFLWVSFAGYLNLAIYLLN